MTSVCCIADHITFDEPTSDISSIEIRDGEVLKFLKTDFNSNRSAGPDNIPPIFPNNCGKSLVTPLSLLFKLSLVTGVIPRI